MSFEDAVCQGSSNAGRKEFETDVSAVASAPKALYTRVMRRVTWCINI